MKRAGVEVERYNKPSWTGLGRLNNRTHRKLLIVDGAIGFTGGVGIAPEWTGDAQDPDHWRDSHFRIEGPVVAQMQAVFMDNWIKTTGAVLHDDGYFPDLEAVGDEQGAGLHELVERRHREHGADVPDGDHVGEADDPPVELVLRAEPRHDRRVPRGDAPRREGADRDARPPHRLEDRAPRVTRDLGPAAEGGRGDLPVSSRRCTTARC